MEIYAREQGETKMQTLDFGEIRDKNPNWLEDYDLTCPYCHGDYEVGGDEYDYEESCDWCEHCTYGMFEVIWNTAFGVEVLDNWPGDGRSSMAEWKESYKLAWDNNFCLIEHGSKQYLLMGMCGLDCTWLIHYTRWKLQGFLDDQDCQDCLGSGGHVFLGKDKRQELCKYLRSQMMTPDQYAKAYADRVATLEAISGEENCHANSKYSS